MRSLLALLLVLLLAAPSAAAPDQWPGVNISNQITRATLQIALAGSAGWLAKPGCRSVLEEFRDQSGILLSDKIAELGIDLVTYLERLRFRDGSLAPPCAKPTTVMFTTPGSKVVFVCGRQLERMARQDRGLLSVLVIHEVLHTLGLGEILRPATPSPSE